MPALTSASWETTFPRSAGISVKIGAVPAQSNGYPTACLQKGLVLVHDGLDLSEEGLGFGVPLVKRGIRILYPGRVEIVSQPDIPVQQVTARFTLDLEEKVIWPGLQSTGSNLLYPIKYFLSALIRHYPPLRGLLTSSSNNLRKTFGWVTVFVKADFSTVVTLVYTVDTLAGIIHVEVDTTNLPGNGISEVFVLNEQGAHYFDLYRDSSGTFQRGEAIGCWDKVTADKASFISDAHRLAFTLQQVEGATLFRGRELIDARLSWSGFGYSFPPTSAGISYDVRIERPK